MAHLRSQLPDRRALFRAVQPDGRLGWVQQVSDRPEKVEPGDTQFHGDAALLLAASAVAELAPLARSQ
jgi:hypothetical protein